ncbi:MAG: radical SAM family heme chaperone HemW [Tissierellia bacterium]|nr:radical SAM family heme chaperone HemW [Tissierellia bacterium]
MKEPFVIRNKSQGVYVHIPFCVKKCDYCDFYSKVGTSWEQKEFERALFQEIDLQRDNLLQLPISSIFFGGGTPSLLPPSFIEKFMEKLQDYGTLLPNREVTVEVNPESGQREYFRSIKRAGVNRVSIGVQSFQDILLERIGRIHNAQKAKESIKIASEEGFTNINVDMMMALPGQRLEDLERDLDILTDQPITHISYYSLILEEGTPLEQRLKTVEGQPYLIPEELDRTFYHKVVSTLEDRGFYQYEISNFSKEGYQSIHNMNYWRLGEYVGLGPGASSNIGACRFKNKASYEMWQKKIRSGKLCVGEEEVLTKLDRQNEWMMLGLRLNEGISPKEFTKIFGEDFFKIYAIPLKKNIEGKTLTWNHGRLVLTEKGRDLANQVEMDFLLCDE